MNMKSRKIAIIFLYAEVFTQKCSTKSKETCLDSAFLWQHSKAVHDHSNVMLQEENSDSKKPKVQGENGFTWFWLNILVSFVFYLWNLTNTYNHVITLTGASWGLGKSSYNWGVLVFKMYIFIAILSMPNYL